MPERDAIPDETVLAAVSRAQLHTDRSEGVPLPRIKQHLGLRHIGWTTQQLRPQLDRLVADGLLRYEWRRSKHTWKITPPGKRRASPFTELPESPQHSAWRRGRVLAEQEIKRVWTRALDSVEAAEGAVNNLTKVKPTSRTYRELGAQLRGAFEDLASATYCLNEWAEPDDQQADVETDDVRGLRRTHWGERV
jgi:DNA-binding PadR family transcriptional regulator